MGSSARLAALFLLASACTPPLLPASVVADLGHKLCSVGHPNAECGQGVLSARSHGPITLDKTKERWIEVTVPYTRKGEAHTMTVRLLVKKLVPCTVTSNVIADDGPNPLLLDNPLTAKLVGHAICEQIGAK